MRDNPEEEHGPHWRMTSGVTPVLLTAIILASVVTGALVARSMIKRHTRDTAVDSETGEPLFI